ncbi:MAG: SIS domain-containing protein [Acidimicrobiales bacterium]
MTNEPTGFLYPFIDAEERDPSALLADLSTSASVKIRESRALRGKTLVRYAEEIQIVSGELAERFRSGGKLLTFGNGGSATDADGTVEIFRSPHAGIPLPALSLVEDSAVMTALANDVGYDVVFSRQLESLGKSKDVAMGFSTSGGSVNVIKAFEEAQRIGMLTVGLAGYEGGLMARSLSVAYCLVVASESVHRIQETQDALIFDIWRTVQGLLAEGRNW